MPATARRPSRAREAHAGRGRPAGHVRAWPDVAVTSPLRLAPAAGTQAVSAKGGPSARGQVRILTAESSRGGVAPPIRGRTDVRDYPQDPACCPVPARPRAEPRSGQAPCGGRQSHGGKESDRLATGPDDERNVSPCDQLGPRQRELAVTPGTVSPPPGAVEASLSQGEHTARVGRTRGGRAYSHARPPRSLLPVVALTRRLLSAPSHTDAAPSQSQ